MNNRKVNVGIDIGGTKVNIGIVNEDGKILDKSKISSENSSDMSKFVKQIAEALFDLINRNEISAKEINFIGVGVPGTVDMNTGTVEYCPNLMWENIPLPDYLKEYFPDVKIKVIQDSWAGAIAEHEFGAGTGYSNMACVTLGTGIGGGVICQDKIFAGGMHCAGEIGHIIVQKGGRKCNCGNYGCLERYASGNGIFEQGYELFPEKFTDRTMNAETVFELAKEGYQPALDLIDNSVRMLAIGLANMVDILSIEAIIISGGLCEHDELIVKPLQQYIEEYGYYSWRRQNRLQIVAAKLGSDAPMLGAAFIYKGIA